MIWQDFKRSDHLVMLLSEDMKEEIFSDGMSMTLPTHKYVLYLHKKVNLCLSTDGSLFIQFIPSQGKDGLTIDLLQSAIGVSFYTKNEDRKKNWYLDIYCYELLPKNKKLRNRVIYSLNFQSNETDCLNWHDAICKFTPKQSDKKTYLVIINPVSGLGNGVKIWETIVQPMLREASFKYNLLTTTHTNHAKEYVQRFNPNDYHAIVCIGGDGILYEVINGLASREDGRQALTSLPIAPIPSGSGNGFVKTLLFECGYDYSIENAVFMAIKGTPKLYDLTDYQTSSDSHRYSFLHFTSGLVADVDIHTEFLRCIGEFRFTLGALYYICFQRKYNGRLSVHTGSDSHSRSNCDKISMSSYSGVSHPGNHVNDYDLPPLDQPIQSGNGWEVIQTNFQIVWVLSAAYVSTTCFASPNSRLNDGLLTIIYCNDCSTLDLLRLLVDMETGRHISNPKVKQLKATAFRYEPLNIADKGLLTLDGELLPYGPCQAKIMPSAASVLSLPTTGDTSHGSISCVC